MLEPIFHKITNYLLITVNVCSITYRFPLLSCPLSWRFYALENGCKVGHPVTIAVFFDT